jgi:hypothetical protein
LQAQFLAMVCKLVEVVEIKSRLNKGLKIGAFYHQYDGRKVLNRDVVNDQRI